MSEVESIFNMNLAETEEPKDFGAVKAGQYGLVIAKVEVKRDELRRVKAEVRHSIDAPDAETIPPGRLPGNVRNNLWFHTSKCLPMIRRFVEAHGQSWDEFTSQVQAGKEAGQDEVEVLAQIFAAFEGLTSQASLTLSHEYTNKDKVVVKRETPTNEIGRYLVS